MNSNNMIGKYLQSRQATVCVYRGTCRNRSTATATTAGGIIALKSCYALLNTLTHHNVTAVITHCSHCCGWSMTRNTTTTSTTTTIYSASKSSYTWLNIITFTFKATC